MRPSGAESRQFDYHQTLAAWKRALIATRRARLITRDELHFAWENGCYDEPVESPREMLARMLLSQPGTTRRLGVRLPWSAPSVYVCYRQVRPVQLIALAVRPANDEAVAAA